MGDKLTPAEAAERLRISRDSLNQLNFRGDGPPRIRISPRKFLYDTDSLEQWLKDREQSGTTARAVA